ncbi:MAG: tRNA (N(6)-L-threonylcarbamoyladenosine(37)-C(2))-methylthiotransferase MtaB [Ruminococcaceae bacterium]|nr:tRNA (N(6)-L-threonylcarbamoyladenosine(37)-C(2))-methylthiotransferase MtaB [Oscillospiraceae bacterium]
MEKMHISPTVGILTLGCKVNQYESEAIAEEFERAGFFVGSPEERCDVYVINTCTVTAESDRKAGQLIRRVAGKNPDAPILVTGCFSQSHPARVAALPQVDYVCGNTDKLSVVRVARELLKKRAKPPLVRVDDVQSAPFEPMNITHFDRTRAYVKIEDGCENRCSYCAIPAARGKVRSKPLADVVREVEGLVRGGCREVVLTGIETASFGKDLEGVTLIDLLEAVDKIEDLERVRLGSLDPTVMRADFVERLAKLRTVVPHFHLSMQSGSARVLAAMRRKYNPTQAMEGIRRLRAALPDVELTTDFIVGFPGETEEDFADTVNFAKEAEFLQMHVFAYSQREGTPAATMAGQIRKEVKKARSAALIKLGAELTQKRLTRALEKPIRTVLFETFEDGYAIGHTNEFFEVAVKSDTPLHAQIHTVRLQAVQGGRLIATPEDNAL